MQHAACAMAPDSMSADSKPDDVSIKGMATPRVGDICIIIHGSMQKFQHGVTLDQVYNLYDEHIDKGGSYMDFFGIIQNVLEVSGFLPKKAEGTAAQTRLQPEGVPEA